MADFAYYITNIVMDCIHNTIVLNTITWCRMYSFTISILSRIHPVMQIHSVITWWRMQFKVITGPVGSASLSLGKLVSWWRRSLIFQPMLLYFDETLVIKVASIINCKLAIYNCICIYIYRWVIEKNQFIWHDHSIWCFQTNAYSKFLAFGGVYNIVAVTEFIFDYLC